MGRWTKTGPTGPPAIPPGPQPTREPPPQTAGTDSDRPDPMHSDSTPIEPSPSRRWVRIINILIVLAVLLYSVSEPTLRALGHWLIEEDRPQAGDLIVVLGGSPAVRAMAAADYFEEGLAPLVFLSRGGLEEAELVKGMNLEDTGNWGLTRKILLERGVPPDKIIMDAVHVDSTLDEARRVKIFLDGRARTKLLLVTSRYHSRRAAAIFRGILGDRAEVISLPSKYDPFDPDNWWRHRTMAKRAVLEFQKMFLWSLESEDD